MDDVGRADGLSRGLHHSNLGRRKLSRAPPGKGGSCVSSVGLLATATDSNSDSGMEALTSKLTGFPLSWQESRTLEQGQGHLRKDRHGNNDFWPSLFQGYLCKESLQALSGSAGRGCFL